MPFHSFDSHIHKSKLKENINSQSLSISCTNYACSDAHYIKIIISSFNKLRPSLLSLGFRLRVFLLKIFMILLFIKRFLKKH